MADMTNIRAAVVASYLLISVFMIIAKGQATAGNEYLKYNFAFSVEDKGLHTREEKSESEGHVSGKYSYMDPYGYLRVIQYNSTPETGFKAYGDTGAMANSSFKAFKVNSSHNAPLKMTESPYTGEKVSSSHTLLEDAPIQRVSNQFSGNSNFLLMVPSYFEASRPLDEVGILSQPPYIRYEFQQESESTPDVSEKSLNVFYSNNANKHIQSKSVVDNTVGKMAAIEVPNNTPTNNTEVEKKAQELLGETHKLAYYNPLWTTPVNIPYFAHPVPFLLALRPDQVVF